MIAIRNIAHAIGCLLFMVAVLMLLSVKDCGDWEVLDPSHVEKARIDD